MGPSRSAIFYGGPHPLLPVPNLLLITPPRTPHRTLRAPSQTDQDLPHMALVIAHTPLLLDQVRNPRAGPQRRFIAPSFRTLAQESLQLLVLGLAQTRLASGASGFLQSRVAFRAILLYPAGHGLSNHSDLAGNGGLVLAPFEQANGLKATFLQGVKIAAYSGRVSHTSLDAVHSEKYRYIMRESVVGGKSLYLRCMLTAFPFWSRGLRKRFVRSERRIMGSRRGFVKPFCHAALLEMTNAVSFRHERGGLLCDFALRMRVFLSFDFAKAARGPA